jgi:secreted PhoX family phosphatase
MKILISVLHVLSYSLCICSNTFSQNIADFVSVNPTAQTTNFIFPTLTHRFQKIMEHGDPLPVGTMMDNFDFTGFMPIGSSSVNGYLSINHELTGSGGVTAMNVNFNAGNKLWQKNGAVALNFASVGGTARNCSGGLTPWGNIITCEEEISTADLNTDGYNDLGWHVEINPATKTVVRKLWAMGHGPKENVAIHSNRRTVYFGNDANPGYLYKFVAASVNDLSSGLLYVLICPSKTGNGVWQLINNTTQADRNNTMALCSAAGATAFSGIEDAEIGPDGKIYFAVKNENRVYRLQDSDPLTGTTTSLMETYVGNASYNITHAGGTVSTPWGTGNDNLAFDGQGNLWVLQDGGNNYIWVVMNNHTQAAPNVKLFGIAPAGAEPTGITFSPDYKFLFMSFQHPNGANNSDFQTDAAGNSIGFDKDIAIVISLNADLGCLMGDACFTASNTNNVGIGTNDPKAKLQVAQGDLSFTSTGTGVIMKSPNGNCWKITVSNTGVLTSVSVPCPE